MKLYIILFIVVLILSSSVICQVEKLKQYNVDPNSLTISGISSGGAMAIQYHFVYSSEIHGIGIFTGVPFGGAITVNGSLQVETNIDNLLEKTSKFVNEGLIDNTTHMAGRKAFIYNGALDTSVPVLWGSIIATIYESYGVDVTTKFDLLHEHGFPTDYYGSPCGEKAELTQFIHNCGYRGVYEMFKILHGETILNPELSVDFSNRDNLHEFEQTEFIPMEIRHHFDTIGLIFVPEKCKNFNETKCKVHIALHGCNSNRGMFGEIMAIRTGYLETAAANDIVIIFPQTRNNAEIGNPDGCWDWFGITQPNEKYLTKEGWQNIALHGMVERVISGGGSPSNGNILKSENHIYFSIIFVIAIFYICKI